VPVRSMTDWAVVVAAACALGLGCAPASAQPAAAGAVPARPPAAGSEMAVAFGDARWAQVIGHAGVPLNVLSKGDPAQPVVLLVHGFRQSSLSWVRQFASTLPASCHLVAVDLRGHGNSGQPWQADAYDSARPWADDLARVIAALDLKRPLLVGWSFGGNVAMDFLRLHGDVPLAGLLLVSTGAGLVLAPPASPGTPPPPTASANLLTNMASVEQSMALLFEPGLDPALRQVFSAASMRVSPFVDRGVLSRRATAKSNADLLPALNIPVTLVFGGRDRVVPATVTSAVKALLPRARVEDFADAGHAPFLDDAERFNRLLASLQCGRP